MIRAAFRVLLLLPLRLARRGFSVVVMLAFVGSAALNIGMVTAASVFEAVSEAFERLGTPTVRQDVDRRLRERDARNERLAARNRSLAARNRQIRTRAQWQRVNLVQRTRWADMRKRQLGQAMASVAALEGRLAAASASGQRLREERAAGSEMVRRRSQAMARRVKLGAARNFAAMAGEAAPVVGTAVIVGATAYELYDACQMLKDLRALDSAFNGDSGIDSTEVCGMTVPSVAGLCTSVGIPVAWCPAGPVGPEDAGSGSLAP